MVATHPSRSAEIRAKVNHPIIDVDGHFQELTPLVVDYVLEYVRKAGGSRLADRVIAAGDITLDQRLRSWFQLSEAERRDRWIPIPSWWGIPARPAVDRATGYLLRLLNERLDDLGIDFSFVYPSQGLGALMIEDDESRQAVCRALNTLHADMFREFSDRMAVPALIPMTTPQEAIAELDYAIGQLGLKSVLIPGHVRRPIPAAQRLHPEAGRFADRVDVYALDSAYDYDPVWQRCVELKVPVANHSSNQGRELRRSISNYAYNHIGGLAAAGEALCKALFMGGVTRRFPTLKFVFLEGGVGWACCLYADLIGHWEKRNAEAVHNMDPANLDVEAVLDFVRRYGDARQQAGIERIREFLAREEPHPEPLDDWAPAQLRRGEDIRDLFVPSFYFGCEADDPLNAWAFNDRVNPFGARLRAVFGSDISHWDAPRMDEVVEESYELVERGLITPEDYRDFMFVNPVTLYAGSNPSFFAGTRIAADVARLLAG